MKLADYIAERQTTATRFAGELGVPVSTITRLLRGERSPGIALVARITTATKGAVSAQDFFPSPSQQGEARTPQIANCGVEGGAGEAAAGHDASLAEGSPAVTANASGGFA